MCVLVSRTVERVCNVPVVVPRSIYIYSLGTLFTPRWMVNRLAGNCLVNQQTLIRKVHHAPSRSNTIYRDDFIH